MRSPWRGSAMGSSFRSFQLGLAANPGAALIADLLPKDSWFRAWMNCWCPLSESPDSYVLFCGMSALGAYLGRSCFIEIDPGHLLVYPMLNILLIGPSGIGKSRAAGTVDAVYEAQPPGAPLPQIIAGATTMESLHFTDLSFNSHAILKASELANFFSKARYMEPLVPYVTELLDYKASIERRTRSSGMAKVMNPSVTVLGCSTPEWLQEQLPDSATSGGFLARFLLVVEKHKSKIIPLPAKMLSRSQRAQLEHDRARCFRDFGDFLGIHSGPIDLNNEAQDVYTEFCINKKPVTGHLEPFAARSGEMVLRMAMLVALSRKKNIIAGDDVACAIKLYGLTERGLQQVAVPLSPQGKLLAKVLEAIGPSGASQVQVRRAMRSYLSAQDVDRLIESLLASKDITHMDGKFYRTSFGRAA